MFSALKKFFTKMRTTPPGRPPNSTSGADAALELSQTVLTILNDMSGVFVNAPYVGMVAGVIQQFITIRNVSSCSSAMQSPSRKLLNGRCREPFLQMLEDNT
jgi:hypothetical protein